MKKRKFSPVRAAVWAFRVLFLTAVLVVFAIGSADAARSICQTSPFLFFAALVGNAFRFDGFWNGAALGVGGAIFLATFFKRRFFCRYVCPLGTTVDAAAVARRKLFKNHWLKNGFVVRTRFFFYFATVFWAFLVLGALFGNAFDAMFNDAFVVPRPDLSAFAFDPFALLSRWTLDRPNFGVAAFVFVATFLLSPYFWRLNVCPCGAFQDVAFFVVRSLVVRPTKRLAARLASVSPNERTESIPETPAFPTPSRRSFLSAFVFGGVGTFGVAAALASATFEIFRRDAKSARKIFFRPPGALPEADFLARCARCGRCVDACPTNILRPVGRDEADAALFHDVLDGGVPSGVPSDAPAASVAKTDAARLVRARFDAPKVVFDDGGFCEKDCVACTRACPTGALTPLKIADKKRVKIARIQFDLERCFIYYQQECSICRRECPFEAIDFVWSEEEYASLPVVDAEKCVGCGRCVAFCPGEPIFSELSDDGTTSEPPDWAARDAKRPRVKALSLLPVESYVKNI